MNIKTLSVLKDMVNLSTWGALLGQGVVCLLMVIEIILNGFSGIPIGLIMLALTIVIMQTITMVFSSLVISILAIKVGGEDVEVNS